MNPLPIIELATVALAAQKPIDSSPRQPLEVELLVSDHQRRCLITDESGRDEIDMAAAVIDPPQKRSERETNSVLKILDELERGNH